LRALRKTGSIREQFEEFILKPARRPSSVYFGPVVIVIDALDAVSEPETRETLISLLSSRAAELPQNFRILITARPDSDICNAFEKHKDVAWLRMEAVIDDKSNLKDIEEFFDHELDDCPGLKWNDRTCRKLTRKSEGDFGWAVFACSFIKHSGGPSDRMSRLLAHPKGAPIAVLEAQDPDSEHEDFFHARIRDTLQNIPEMLAWHPLHLPAVDKYPLFDMRPEPAFPMPVGHPSLSHPGGGLGGWIIPEPMNAD